VLKHIIKTKAIVNAVFCFFIFNSYIYRLKFYGGISKVNPRIPYTISIFPFRLRVVAPSTNIPKI
jgi:hypothetical protein